MILTLQKLSEAIRSGKNEHNSELMCLLEMALGAQELVEDLNSITGTDRALLTNCLPSSLKAIFEASKYKLQFLRNRIALSVDALNQAIVELPMAKRSEKSDQFVESEDDIQKSIVATRFSPVDPYEAQRSTFREHQQGTGQWLLESGVFHSWLSERNECLAIVGKPGSGKTVLTLIIVQFLRSTFDNKIAVIGIYLNGNSPNQTVENILGSILRQIIMQRVGVSKSIKGYYNQRRETKDQADIDALVKVLDKEILTFYRSFIVVDALGEIGPVIRIRLLEILHLFEINLLVTSRTNRSVEQELRGFTTLDIGVSNDIERFVETELSIDSRLARILSNMPNFEVR